MPNEKKIKCSLNNLQMNFLDKLSRDCKFDASKDKGRAMVMGALIKAALTLKINSLDVKNEEDLKRAILQAMVASK